MKLNAICRKWLRSPNVNLFWILIPVVLLTSLSSGQNVPYCCSPSWAMNVVKPNILFIQDVTGSQLWRASWQLDNGYYRSFRRYYGYFVDSVNYYYSNGVFYPSGYQPAGAVGPYPGKIMNWAIMSRIDVTRKVLTGGKGTPASQYPKNHLLPIGYALNGSSWPCYLCTRYMGTVIKYRFRKVDANGWDSDNQVDIDTTRGNAWGNYAYPETLNLTTFMPPTPPNRAYVCDISVPNADWMSAGVVRQICDKDLDTDFDEDAPRIAIMFFSTNVFDLQREFYESDGPAAVSAEDFINDINNVAVQGATPVGNAVFDATCYIRWCVPRFGSFTKTNDAKRDPYNTWAGDSVWCRKSFCIILGDGESNSDTPISSYAPLPAGPFVRNLYNYDNMDEDYDHCHYGGDSHHPADDYAYYSHITDLRPDLPDKQNIEWYSIFSFGTGSGLFKEIAKDGGFKDADADYVPDSVEWDEEAPYGVPDHYYEAEDGYKLEQAILDIIYDILAGVSSASGVAVVSTGTKSGGSTVQAQFYPRRKYPNGTMLDWVGTCTSVWLDPFGNIREDNNAPGSSTLHLQNDYVITMKWNQLQNNVIVTQYYDSDGNGVVTSADSVGVEPIESLKTVWDGGKWLWNNYNPPTNRVVWTSLSDGSWIPFDPANAMTLKDYLGVGISLNKADTIIRYVRGDDVDTVMYRSRTIDGKVWKLGDVINSGPVMLGTPVERYDYIYGDMSYNKYYAKWKNRHQMVYVGGNDGMLHAFNGGLPEMLSGDPMQPMRILPGAGLWLGQEMWSYIPRNLLPQVRWLLDKTYAECHVYYVDLKPYITEAQVFTADSMDGVHLGGWGSILIGGMRLGGTKQRCTALDTCRSAYFAIDVSDPFNPEPMWEFTDPRLQYTVCYSTVVKVKNSWFLVFGSGPMTCGGDCSQTGRIFVLDLKTGAKLAEFLLPDLSSFVTNVFACDWGIDYTVDRIYFGDCYKTGTSTYAGKVYRILTNNDTDPLNWTMSMVMDMGQAVTAEGSVATDEFNHLWVYFGTGRFFSDDDEIDDDTYSYVGFRDDTTHTTDPAQLYNVTNVTVDTSDVVDLGGGVTVAFDSLVSLVNNKLGWYRQFPIPGERCITTTLVMGGACLFTTYVPTGDICSYGGEGYLYALYYRTGTAYTIPFLGDTLGENRISMFLGSGIPSEPSLYVTADETKIFIQVGGGIVSPETGIPGLPRSGVILWKGK